MHVLVRHGRTRIRSELGAKHSIRKNVIQNVLKEKGKPILSSISQSYINPPSTLHLFSKNRTLPVLYRLFRHFALEIEFLE